MPSTASFDGVGVRAAGEPQDRLAARAAADLLRGGLEQLRRRHPAFHQARAARGHDQGLAVPGLSQGRPPRRRRPPACRRPSAPARGARRRPRPGAASDQLRAVDLLRLRRRSGPRARRRHLAGACRARSPAASRVRRADARAPPRPAGRCSRASTPGRCSSARSMLISRSASGPTSASTRRMPAPIERSWRIRINATLPGPVHVRSAAELAGVVPHLDHTDQVAVLLAEERDRALGLRLVERRLVDAHRVVEREAAVGFGLGLLQDLSAGPPTGGGSRSGGGRAPRASPPGGRAPPADA